MAKHRCPGCRSGFLNSVRVRAVLALGLVLGFGAVGTYAFWTDEAVVNAGTLTSATLRVRVNDANPYAAASLSMTAMVPGSTSAEVLTVKNVGTAPLKYSFTGGLSGTNAADFAAGTAGLLVTIRQGGAKSGATCTGGTVVFTEAGLTATTTTVLLPKTTTSLLGAANGAGAGGGTEALCVQIKLSDSASTLLQGKTATATFSANATSDLS